MEAMPRMSGPGSSARIRAVPTSTASTRAGSIAPMSGLDEYRDRGCAGGGIATRLCGWINADIEHAGGWRHALDLGDHLETLGVRLDAQTKLPVPGHGLSAKCELVAARSICCDIGAPLGGDPLQEIAHTVGASAAPMRWLVATKRARASDAAPRSIVSAARLAPSRRSRAIPAT